MIDAMDARREKKKVSELQLNWIGKGHLNAGESDLMYKYHVVSFRTSAKEQTNKRTDQAEGWLNCHTS